MKRTVLKSLAVFMALNILFSATGLAMFEHTCHAIGLTTNSFTEEDSCSMESHTVEANDGQLSFKQNECCETHAHFKNVDLEISSSFQQVVWPALKLEEISNYFSFATAPKAFQLQPSYDFMANAPPESGRQILIKVQSFLI
ncbi:hypothetical protein [uncultured Arcticibacterium sp.]|uniref:HYC_CC_PP family protein n=1 Tax=uncultured Arcticibacterium sp. TaxID=2173042 RepID=UPI0030F4B3C9